MDHYDIISRVRERCMLIARKFSVPPNVVLECRPVVKRRILFLAGHWGAPRGLDVRHDLVALVTWYPNAEELGAFESAAIVAGTLDPEDAINWEETRNVPGPYLHVLPSIVGWWWPFPVASHSVTAIDTCISQAIWAGMRNKGLIDLV